MTSRRITRAAWAGLRTALACTLALVLFATAALGQDDGYHILLTNDDGIQSPGIQVLAEALKEVGQVHVVAPCGERSGSSMSVSLRDELRVRVVERDGTQVGHCVDTTPAGAVLLAITALAPEGGFDLVISGINRGANVGHASHMSGTVGAAMMGALYELPAVAVSLGAGRLDFNYSSRFVAGFVNEMKSRPAMPGVVFSINIPQALETEIAGVRIAKMGGMHLTFAYEEMESDTEGRRFQPRIGAATDAPEGSDTEALMSDMITITPIFFDWTAYPALDELRGWGLSPAIGRARIRDE